MMAMPSATALAEPTQPDDMDGQAVGIGEYQDELLRCPSYAENADSGDAAERALAIQKCLRETPKIPTKRAQ
jgi:hypothetical protein